MATVTCTKQCYFYRGDVQVSSSRSTVSLTAGLTFTPSHPNHMPYYDSSIYTSYRITYNGINYTTGSMTCPSTNFTIVYNFYGAAEAKKVTCTKRYYFYRGNTLKDSYSETETLTAGLTFTPSSSSHMPSYSKTTYTWYEITYNGRDYTTGSMTCPDSNFTVYYYFHGSPEIDKWSWSKSNGSATAYQTSQAYSAVTSKGKTSNFSYLVWNDMVDKVKNILDATNGTWNNSYATYSATRMSASDKVLTARRFNSLRYNIGLRYSTGINDVYSGNVIYGWYFTTLANCINGWIDKL